MAEGSARRSTNTARTTSAKPKPFANVGETMSTPQKEFYLEQARMCERAAIIAENEEERLQFLDGRDAWLALADLIVPPVGISRHSKRKG